MTPALLLALLIAIAYSADRTALSSQVAHLSSRAAHLEAERDSLHSRVELMEQASKAPLAQPSAEAALPERRGLQTVPNDRATVRVDEPDGISELILGGEAAADNVVLRKAHERDGAAFTLSRGDTQVLRVDPAGNATVLTDPLHASGAVKVGGSLEAGGELLLGGVRLSAAMLSGMILNAGPLPPPAPPIVDLTNGRQYAYGARYNGDMSGWCSGWNSCGDAQTCANWACQYAWHGTPISYEVVVHDCAAADQVPNWHLFGSTIQLFGRTQPVLSQRNWSSDGACRLTPSGGSCPISGVTSIICNGA